MEKWQKEYAVYTSDKTVCIMRVDEAALLQTPIVSQTRHFVESWAQAFQVSLEILENMLMQARATSGVVNQKKSSISSIQSLVISSRNSTSYMISSTITGISNSWVGRWSSLISWSFVKSMKNFQWKSL